MAADNSLLEFDFAEIDDGEFELHLLNKGVEQRTNVTGQDQLRQKGVVLCGRLAEVVHGHAKDGQEPCTLAIFEWYVHTREPGKRIKFAQIGIHFKSSKEGLKYDPWVRDCAPWGAYSLFESNKKVEETKNWNPSLKFGQEGIVTAELPFTYELKETVDRQEHIYVDGCPLPPKGTAYYHPDRHSALEWNLFENEGQRSGIPRYFRTAALLDRTAAGPERFMAHVSLKVKVSMVEDATDKIKSFVGRRIKDEPIVFNPTLKPRTHQFDKMVETLGSVSLEDEMGFLLFRNGVGAKAKANQAKEGDSDDSNSGVVV